MKKIIASTFAAALIATGLGVASAPVANAADAYGPKTVAQSVNAVVAAKGKITKKKAKALIKQVNKAKRKGLISKKQAAKLIKKINKDTKKSKKK